MKMIIRNNYGSKTGLRTYISNSKSWSLNNFRSNNCMNFNCSFSWGGSIHMGNVNLIRQK